MFWHNLKVDSLTGNHFVILTEKELDKVKDSEDTQEFMQVDDGSPMIYPPIEKKEVCVMVE